MYSFGVTLWELIERLRPFEGYDPLQICALWVSSPNLMALPPLTVQEGTSTEDRQALAALQALVTECTALDPDVSVGRFVVVGVRLWGCCGSVWAADIRQSADSSMGCFRSRYDTSLRCMHQRAPMQWTGRHRPHFRRWSQSALRLTLM